VSRTYIVQDLATTNMLSFAFANITAANKPGLYPIPLAHMCMCVSSLLILCYVSTLRHKGKLCTYVKSLHMCFIECGF